MTGTILRSLLNAVLWCVPLYKLMPRYGMSRWVALAAAVPAVGTILLWVLALALARRRRRGPEPWKDGDRRRCSDRRAEASATSTSTSARNIRRRMGF
jgi:hypothetical protein